MLVFPTEPAYAHLSGRFHDRNLENLSADFPMRRFALLRGEIDEGLISNRLDEAISQDSEKGETSGCFLSLELALEFPCREKQHWDK